MPRLHFNRHCTTAEIYFCEFVLLNINICVSIDIKASARPPCSLSTGTSPWSLLETRPYRYVCSLRPQQPLIRPRTTGYSQKPHSETLSVSTGSSEGGSNSQQPQRLAMWQWLSRLQLQNWTPRPSTNSPMTSDPSFSTAQSVSFR